MPTISLVFEGFNEASLSPVANHSPPMRRRCSRPQAERTWWRALSMACRYAPPGAYLVEGSFHGLPVGRHGEIGVSFVAELGQAWRCHTSIVRRLRSRAVILIR